MNEYQLTQTIKVKDCNGLVIEGIIKGLSLDKKDELHIVVEYLTPIQNTFKIENIVTE
ncbi:hypothetical protein [Clostridium tagluense]|uniref:Uncharacterized protein n=1 Tax=Clostridium tagluense TaxID=360422 RepID=A0A401UUE1_9CLOT|nr:hypothetical protein [Clostridium tagluense]GCD13189.1 hypothetical protein Ctaglu_48120 [Clostridium tagluense]